jgi:hypothetical protein
MLGSSETMVLWQRQSSPISKRRLDYGALLGLNLFVMLSHDSRLSKVLRFTLWKFWSFFQLMKMGNLLPSFKKKPALSIIQCEEREIKTQTEKNR